MSTEKNFEKYLEIIESERCASKKWDPRIVTDEQVLREYEMRHGVSLGIVYKSGYNTFVVDLVKKEDGSFCTFERLVKTRRGNSVVIIPLCGGKIVLLKQYRHALGETQLCFPRGYGEPEISPEENARKEISEELSCDSGGFIFLGHIVADSGVCGEKVNVFLCEAQKPSPKQGYEDIEAFITVTEEELSRMIANREINDGFTLSAYMLYKSFREMN